jgi:hypothetical protein
MVKYMNINNFEEPIESKHGKIGMATKNIYKEGAQMLIVSEMLSGPKRD